MTIRQSVEHSVLKTFSQQAYSSTQYPSSWRLPAAVTLAQQLVEEPLQKAGWLPVRSVLELLPPQTE